MNFCCGRRDNGTTDRGVLRGPRGPKKCLHVSLLLFPSQLLRSNSEKPWRCRIEAEVSGFKIEQFLWRVAVGRLSFRAQDFRPVSESKLHSSSTY